MKARIVVSAQPGNVIRAQALADDAVVIELALTRTLMSKVVNAKTVLAMVGGFAGKQAGDLVNALVATVNTVLGGKAEAETPIPNPPAWFVA